MRDTWQTPLILALMHMHRFHMDVSNAQEEFLGRGSCPLRLLRNPNPQLCQSTVRDRVLRNLLRVREGSFFRCLRWGVLMRPTLKKGSGCDNVLTGYGARLLRKRRAEDGAAFGKALHTFSVPDALAAGKEEVGTVH